jgi:hypothetical protein
MGVLARRLGCYFETGESGRRAAPIEHAPWPQFCESRLMQLAAIHLPVRAEATVGCAEGAGVARYMIEYVQDLYGNAEFSGSL